MKIAVTYENGQVFSHFGKAPALKIYEIGADHEITNTEIITIEEIGHVARIGVILTNEVKAVICGSVGKNAFEWLQKMHVHVFAGVSGDADERIRAMFRRELTELKADNCGELEDDGNGCSSDCSTCSHHCG